MKYLITLIVLLSLSINLFAQKGENSNTKFIAGLSGPELLHAGITHRISNFSQLGISAGAGPSMGMVWSSINLEHRLYIGRKSAKSNQKTYFFRQGTTFFPSAIENQHFTVNITSGKDFPFVNSKNGITIDLGVFYLAGSEKSSLILDKTLNLWPALRFEFYFSM